MVNWWRPGRVMLHRTICSAHPHRRHRSHALAGQAAEAGRHTGGVAPSGGRQQWGRGLWRHQLPSCQRGRMDVGRDGHVVDTRGAARPCRAGGQAGRHSSRCQAGTLGRLAARGRCSGGGESRGWRAGSGGHWAVNQRGRQGPACLRAGRVKMAAAVCASAPSLSSTRRDILKPRRPLLVPVRPAAVAVLPVSPYAVCL